MQAVSKEKEKKDRHRAVTVSVLFHTTILLLLLLPLLQYPDPPPGQEGILIALGEPDEGEGPLIPGGPDEPIPEETIEPEQEEVKPEPVTTPPERPREDEALTQAREAEINRKQAEARKEREEKARKAEQERLEQERKARQAREEEEAAELLKNMKRGGGGNTGKEGKAGRPDGDAAGEVEEGESTGTGMVGAGLQGRGVVYAPELKDESNNRGTVAIAICLDREGNVTEAKCQVAGSTITSGELCDKAVKNALRWRFKPGTEDRQCGRITYTFNVR